MLQLTTIGRYGSNSAKSKIPIGSYYGHSFLLPWEMPKLATLPSTEKTEDMASGSDEGKSSLAQQQQQSSQAALLSRIGVYMSLQEDIQCRYSLACNRLESLLSTVEKPANGATHTQHYLNKAKRSDEDVRVVQAYSDCINLQLQLNIAQRAIERLQRALGVSALTAEYEPRDDTLTLQQSSTDRLRVLCELLLDCLVGLTYPAMPQPPLSLYSCVTPPVCEELFRNLCVHGSKKMQLYAGLFLVRMCGCQAWWGRFLGNMLQQYFSAEQLYVFPQDRYACAARQCAQLAFMWRAIFMYDVL